MIRSIFKKSNNIVTKINKKNYGSVTDVLGAQWGDEGKGKLTDILAEKSDVIARFNGGDNAGHTIVADGKKYAFHLLPCGLIYPHTKNVIGNGCVVNLDSLFSELNSLSKQGINYKDRLLISNKAHLIFDYHKIIDKKLEEILKDNGENIIGTTKKGIGPAYAFKAFRNSTRVGKLLYFDEEEFKMNVNIAQTMFDFEYDVQKDIYKIQDYLPKIKKMITSTEYFINNSLIANKSILAEGANASMLDTDFGTYPYVTSSTTSIGGVISGLGVPNDSIGDIIGVVKAYTTRVGSGPFVTELTDSRGGGEREDYSYETDIGLHMQNIGHEYGVTTGRKRRCGWLDMNVLAYTNIINNYSQINLTKLDVLDGLDYIKIACSYYSKIKDITYPLGYMPSTIDELKECQPEYIIMEGWKEDTSKCKSFEELPKNAQAYINKIEELIEVPIKWIGVGQDRKACIEIKDK